MRGKKYYYFNSNVIIAKYALSMCIKVFTEKYDTLNILYFTFTDDVLTVTLSNSLPVYSLPVTYFLTRRLYYFFAFLRPLLPYREVRELRLRLVSLATFLQSSLAKSQ